MNHTQKLIAEKCNELQALTQRLDQENGTKTCWLVLSWPSEIGTTNDAQMQVSSNLDMRASKMHLREVVCSFVVDGLGVEL